MCRCRHLSAGADRVGGGAGQLHVQLKAGLVRRLLHQRLDGVLGNVRGRRLVHGALHHRRLHVQVFKLLLKLYERTSSFLIFLKYFNNVPYP